MYTTSPLLRQLLLLLLLFPLLLLLLPHLDINLDEEHGQRHGKVGVSFESYMAETHLEVVEGKNSLTERLVMLTGHYT